MTRAAERATRKREVAWRILSDLELMEKWQRYGRPVVVGALAYDLLVDPDIDMEIYCPDLRIEHGFQVLGECALNTNVTKARFSNELSSRDEALYWQLRYRCGRREEWKIDMWSAPMGYRLPRAENLVEPMKKALTPETRGVIVELKEERLADPTLRCASVDLYRAVLEDGVRTAAHLRDWLNTHETGMLTDWKPASAVQQPSARDGG
jgi:hypothetical protein